MGADSDCGKIVAFDLTDEDVDDASNVERLPEQLSYTPTSFATDDARDQVPVLEADLVSAGFIVPHSTAAALGPATITRTQRAPVVARQMNTDARLATVSATRSIRRTSGDQPPQAREERHNKNHAMDGFPRPRSQSHSTFSTVCVVSGRSLVSLRSNRSRLPRSKFALCPRYCCRPVCQQ
jgi:hypothetical protein